VRVLVSMEIRFYREVIGAAIQHLKPHLEMVVVEPENLEAEVAKLSPEAVIGDVPEPATGGARLAWVEFRPYEQPATRIRLGDRRWELREMSLEELLSVVDEAERSTPRGTPTGSDRGNANN
jgi:hypothetical protein